jgi:S1-C subfamily serine protease
MYDLPKTDYDDLKNKWSKVFHNKLIQGGVLLIIIAIAVSFSLGNITVERLQWEIRSFFQKVQSNTPNSILNEAPQFSEKYVSNISYEQAIIDSVKSASPSVVSIIISKNLPVYEEQLVNPFGENSPFDFLVPQQVQKGTKLQEVGAGSGFIVSQDGLVLTNKHVVSDPKADYTVITNEGQKYPAKVLALDPVQDLAIIKIQSDPVKNPGQATSFPAIRIGDSDGIQVGQGAIAIGNALGEFSNTVSVGVVSGLGRTVSASDQTGGFTENLGDIVQTDAAINPGNSGGPLINLKGEVIGINTAMAQGAQSIGFAIPINVAKKDINQIIATNKITYPFLGVRYVAIDDQVKQKYKLSVDYGVIVLKGDKGELAITPGSAAEKAGLKENDVILEFNGEKITKSNTLGKIIVKYNPDDKVTLKILRSGKEMMVEVTLGERN